METERTENNQEEIVQPQGTENNQEEIVQPQPHDLDDDGFNEYINGIQSGNMPNMPNVPNEPDKKPQENTEEAEEPKKEEPYKSFDTREEFQNFMNETISKRLKNHKEAEKRYSDFERRAKSLYNGEENAIDKLLTDAEARAAEDSVKTPEEFAELLKLRNDAQRLREIESRQRSIDEQIAAKQREWLRDSENLKAVIPDFDFDKAMENETFRDNVLRKNMSVAASYIAISKEPPKKQERKPVFEAGAGSGNAGSMGAINPMNMSDDDFSGYIERIRNEG